jgi:hypothetical protein
LVWSLKPWGNNSTTAGHDLEDFEQVELGVTLVVNTRGLPRPKFSAISQLHGTGVRRTELTRLMVSDIDSRRMSAEFLEQYGAEHHVAIVLAFGGLNVHNHQLATLAQKVRPVICRQPLAAR